MSVSIENGYDGVLLFKAETSELVTYYIREFGASHAGLSFGRMPHSY